MKKIIMILNQVQAGIGGEEQANIPPNGKKSALGPGVMMEPYFNEFGGKIIATLYCGDDYYLNNTDEVVKKMVAMIKKLSPDAVICGPAFNYPKFGEMAGNLAYMINQQTDIPAFSAMSEENPACVKYKDKEIIIKMPKKGGVGLNEALKKISGFSIKLANKEKILSSEEEGYFE